MREYPTITNNMSKFISKAVATYIYIIGLRGLDGYSKIGFSNNVNRRVRDISTSSPFKPYEAHSFLLRSEIAARAVEDRSHSALKNFRVNGEWFKLPPLVAWQTVKPIAEKWNKSNPPRTIGEAIAISAIN